MPAQNLTLYAKWTLNSYNVTFDAQGGSAVAGKTVAYNALVTQPSDPTKAGYTFGGWYREAACTTAWDFDTDTMPAQNLTLYAKWILNMVDLNHIPVINAEDKELMVGDPFDPLEGVTAHDDEDGDIVLTAADVIDNNVDTSKAGTYSVTYKVKDSQGASSTRTITVVVKAEPAIPTDNTSDTPGQESSGTNTSTKTGDHAALGWFGLMLAGSSSMLLGLGVKSRKRKK